MANVRSEMQQMLRQLELTTIFGNPGSTEETFLQDLPDDFRYVLGLQEASVVAMADGYAQASGEAVLVNLHTAAGLGNAMGNVVTAWHNQTPMIILAGQQTREMLLIEPFLTHMQPAEMPRPYVKWSYETTRAEDAPAALMRAYATAMQSPAGPVFLSIPMDDMDRDCPPAPVARRFSPTLQVSSDEMAGVARTIDASPSPVLVVGGAVDRGTGWADVIRLAERLDCDVWAAPEEGRPGFPETHPLYRGVAPAAKGPLAQAMEGHDLIVVIGAPVFRYYPYVAGSYLPVGSRLIHITDSADEIARAPVGDAVRTDPAKACAMLADLVAPRDAKPRTAFARARRAGVSTTITAEVLFAALADVKPHDAVIVQESPSNQKALRAHLPTSSPRSFFSMSSGVLGYAPPAAVGVALRLRDEGSNRKVLCIVGDGALQYVIQSLWTAAQLDLPILFIVLRNREYAILKAFGVQQETPGVPGLDIRGIDCVKLAEGYGCTAESVDSPLALHDVLKHALARTSPHLVEVGIDPEVPPLL